MKSKKFKLKDLLPLVQRLQLNSLRPFWLHWCIDSISVTIIDDDIYKSFSFYSFQTAEEHLVMLKEISDLITKEERPEA